MFLKKAELGNTSFGWTVQQIAEVENNMNSVERIVCYLQDIEQEAPDGTSLFLSGSMLDSGKNRNKVG